jgi:hypothetical protein
MVRIVWDHDFISADRSPDQCPICHTRIKPIVHQSFRVTDQYGADLELIFQCPNEDCAELFIGYFLGGPGEGVVTLLGVRPQEPATVEFDQAVKDISADYCKIYEEAHKAEAYGLKQICGVGYRKALEFLIKDYLIATQPEKAATIRTTMLGPCIKSYVNDPKVKAIAERATWLGNDETHYERRWQGKDLSVLKQLIALAVHWIVADKLTQDALADMPEPKKN